MSHHRSLSAVLSSLIFACSALFSHGAQPEAAAPAKIDDGLNMRFANGIAAIAEGKIITVDDIRREIAPLIEQVQKDSHNEKEFNEKVQQLQDSIVQELVDRVLIVKEFYKDENHKIPANIIDNNIAEIIATQYDGDRSKYLAYLRARGISQKDYRKETEEDIVYNYMRQQKRKSATTVSPVKIENFYKENKERFYQEDAAHLRLIQIAREGGDSDDMLRAKIENLIKQLNAGTAFADLARQNSKHPSRSKGGDQGWMRRSDLVKDFSDAIADLEKGQYTKPIIMPDGAFLLFVEERKHAGVQPLDEVRPQVERMLVQQASSEAEERWLEKLRRTGYVKHF